LDPKSAENYFNSKARSRGTDEGVPLVT